MHVTCPKCKEEYEDVQENLEFTCPCGMKLKISNCNPIGELSEEEVEILENSELTLDDIPVNDVSEKDVENAKKTAEKFNSDLEKELKKSCKRPNILICGYTGVGKSSLINALLDVNAKTGTGKPVSQQFLEYKDERLCIWDSKGMELDNTVNDFISGVYNFICEKQNTPSVDEHIHIAIYAIDASCARVQDADITLIKKFQKKIKTLIIVFTKCDIATQSQIDEMKEVLNQSCPNVKIYCSSDPKSEFVIESRKKTEQCRKWLIELINGMIDIIPEAYKNALAMKQIVDIDRKIKAIRSLKTKALVFISTATVAAAAVGAVPIPGSDAPILIGIQVTMIFALAKLYDVPCLGKAALTKQLLPLAGRMLATSFLKLIPGFGSIVCATVAGSLTGGIGYYCINSFERQAIDKAEGKEPQEDLFDNLPGIKELIQLFGSKK